MHDRGSKRWKRSGWWQIIVMAAVCLLSCRAPAATSYGLMVSGVMSAYGFGPPSVYGRNVVFRNRSSSVVMEAASRRIIFDGLQLYLNSSVTRLGEDWTMAPIDAVDSIGTLLYPARSLRAVGWSTVVLDAGHGGDDPGAMYGRQAVEKKLTLDVVQRIYRRLRDCRVECVLIRDRDVAVGLEERSFKGSRLKADVWVSVHFNASRNTTISGIETYVASAAGYPSTAEALGSRSRASYPSCRGNATDGANLILAYAVHKGVVTSSRADDRGIRRARFSVLRNATCPATLVECGFLSNAAERNRILDSNYRDRLAEGVTRGILTYLTRVRDVHLPPVYSP